ncbi:MAG: T9SS type A sorting domain-containing protein, partial [Candidatus Cloacimonadales bacterium]
GDDNNSGLTADQPLRSTSKAFQLIKNNPDNPRTVHLPAGDYSNCANGYDNLPITVKSNTTLQGVSAEETIIDGADMKVVYMVGVINASQTGENVTIRNLSLLNRRGCAIKSSSVMNLKIEDIIVDNCNNIGTWDRTLLLGSVAYSSVYMKNVLIQNSVSNFYEAAGRVEGIDVVMDNVIVRNNTNTHDSDAGLVGILEVHIINILTVKNSQFINNQSAVQNDGGSNIRFYAWSDTLSTIMDNCLFANNSNGSSSRNIHLNSNKIMINNCTFANNTGGMNYTTTLIASESIEVYNTIFSNNSQIYAMAYGPAPILIDNCLFSNDPSSVIYSNNPHPYTLGDNNLYGANPLFAGTDPSNPTYYMLAGDDLNGYSPAIDAGSRDFSFMPDWYEVSEFDLYGNPRIFDDRVDIGCYEYQGYTVDNMVETVTDKFTAFNYPNPFNPETTIEFNNPVQGEVNVSIYNLKGQLVKKLLQENLSQGVHKIVWNGTDSNEKQVSSGVYFYRINSANKESITKKIILMK